MFVLRKLRGQSFVKNVSYCQKVYTAPMFCVSSSSYSSMGKAKKAQLKSERTRINSQVTNNCVYGQPTSATHPHLIKHGELVPGISAEEFRQRRQRLMAGVQIFSYDNFEGKDKPKANHIMLVPSATKKFMSGKIPYHFRQNSDFYYLTGCLEPDSMLMLTIDTDSNVISTLFMRPKDKYAEMWDGARTGTDNAITLFGVDDAFPIDDLTKVVASCLNEMKPILWYDEQNSELEQITNGIRSVAEQEKIDLHSPEYFIQSMRLFKSSSEMSLMRRTCQIAAESMNDVISESRPGQTEHYLYALIDYKCRMRNASYLAYPPVVAGGKNATTIHYVDNTQVVRDGELVLMDAGCEYGGYTSDLTRTWPINGEFSRPQKVLYDVVVHLQKELIGTLMKPGGETLDELFDTMCYKLGKYLQEVGLVPKDVNTQQELARYGFKFCPHHVSHYLGMDVHDTPAIPRTLRILPGMVFTIEPGIYIASDDKDVPQEFRGIGVRVEDDILINSDNEIEVLTANCAKDRKIIEMMFKEKRFDE